MNKKDIFNRVSNGFMDPEYASFLCDSMSEVNCEKLTFDGDEDFINSHIVNGKKILLGVTFISFIYEVLKKRNYDNIVIKNFSFFKQLEIDSFKEISCKVNDKDNFINILFGEEILAKGNFYTSENVNLNVNSVVINDVFSDKCGIISLNEIYDIDKYINIEHGTSLRTLDCLKIIDNTAYGLFSLKDNTSTFKGWSIHPAYIEAGIVAGMHLLGTDYIKQYIPVSIESVSILEGDFDYKYCISKLNKVTENKLVIDFQLLDKNYVPVVEVVGFTGLCISEVYNKDNSSNESISDYLESLFHKFLPDKKLDLEKNFMDMGITSMDLIDLASTIESDLDIELYPTIFFEYKNMNQFLCFLQEKYPEKMKSEILPHNISLNNYNLEEKTIDQDIAIIGISAYLPKSENLDEFWEHIYNNDSLIEEIPQEHFNYNLDKLRCNKGSFISNVYAFDNSFFKISDQEAKRMDPQLRKLLQNIYHCCEDSGYINKIKGTKTGMYVGACFHDYNFEILRSNQEISSYDGTGNAATMLSNYPSFIFDLKGPSQTIDTACSSSLVALHNACLGLMNGDCDMAFVSGVNLLLSPWHYLYFSKTGVLSSSGECHSFDNRADGYVPGEAIASILIKPLDKAIEDNDNIYAIIKGTSTNHGGYTPSISSPSINEELSVMADCWRKSRISPSNISYIECHGTGTILGDPIEIKAIQGAFDKFGVKDSICYIGSVKSNIGHTEGAAGLMGIIKVVLSMKNKIIPAMANFKELNPYIKLQDSPLRINKFSVPWENETLIAGVNSFGFGGTYAHVVLEEYKKQDSNKITSFDGILFCLSAFDDENLISYAKIFLRYLENNRDIITDEFLYDLCYTLALGRQSMSARFACIISDVDSLIVQLTSFVTEKRIVQKLNENQVLLNACQDWMNKKDIKLDVLFERPGRVISLLPVYPFRESIHKLDFTQQCNDNHVFNIETAIEEVKKEEFIIDRQSHYISQHIVNNQNILVGAFFIKLAHDSLISNCPKNMIIQLNNIYWVKPLILKENYIRLYLEKDFSSNKICIYSENDSCPVVFFRCEFEYVQNIRDVEFPQCNVELNKRLSKVDLYSFLKTVGLNLGESFQLVDSIKYNESKAISNVTCNKDLGLSFDPCLIDSIFHILTVFNLTEKNIKVPVRIKSIKFFDYLESNIKVYAKKNCKNDSCDLLIFNELGDIRLEVKEFVSQSFFKPNKGDINNIVFTSDWNKIELPAYNTCNLSDRFLVLSEKNEYATSFSEECFTFKNINNSENLEKYIEKCKILNCIYIVDINKDVTNDFHIYFKQLLFILKLFSRFPEIRINFVLLVERNFSINSTLITSLTASLKTASKELLNFCFVSILYDNIDEILKHIILHNSYEKNIEFMYNNGVLYEKRLAELKIEDNNTDFIFRKNGVYLILGNGKIAQYIISDLRKKYDSTIVVLSRNIKNIFLYDKKVIEKEVDFNDREQLKSILDKINLQYDGINGVINCVGCIQDSLIVNKDMSAVHSVLYPKIDITLIIDELTQLYKLDFFIMISSISSLLGNIGQVDYSYANEFLNQFCIYRNSLVSSGKRFGNTFSINYPYWEDGGMTINDSMKRYYNDKFGILPINKDVGLDIVDHLNYLPQLVYLLSGKRDKIIESFGIQPSNVIQQTETNDCVIRIIEILNQLISENIDIVPETHISILNLDSIAYMEFVNQINSEYNIDITPGFLFNNPTIIDIADYVGKKLGVNQKNDIQLIEDKSIEGNEQSIVDRNQIKLDIDDSIAIIGYDAILPQINEIDDFWDKLINGECMISNMPDERYKIDKILAPFGAFIKDPYIFDASFFNISNREAELMDPQQRLLLMTVWHAIENSGYSPKSLENSNTGVFIGCSTNDYLLNVALDDNLREEPYFAIGNANSIISNRVSYVLGLKGPSETIDTACSSSLVAIIHAIDSIKLGYCDIAIAGGVNLILDPILNNAFAKGGLLSLNGSSKPFDKEANGYVRGEGVGVVVLKKLKQALADNDYIYGVIKNGYFINHNGYSNSLTSPTPNGQAELLKKCYERDKVDLSNMCYIETHGTGTQLGDSIEIEGLREAFTNYIESKKIIFTGKCGLGSVKSNIGHLEAASGVVSLIKSLMILEHKKIPPTVNISNINIDENDEFFYIVNKTQSLDINEQSMIGISSFGFGGTNAHLLVKSPLYYNKDIIERNESEYICLYSAKGDEELVDYLAKHLAFLKTHSNIDLLNYSFTLALGREHFKYRIGFAVRCVSDLIKKIEDFLLDECRISNLNVTDNFLPNLLSNVSGRLFVNSLMETKNYKVLIQLWSLGQDVNWNLLFKNKVVYRIKIPNYPFKVIHFSCNKESTINYNNNETQNLTQQSDIMKQCIEKELKDESLSIISNLRKWISIICKIPEFQLDNNVLLENYGIDSIMSMEVIELIFKQYGIRVYANEIRNHNTIDKLAKLIGKELDLVNTEKVTESVEKKVIYIFSSPRSGSTLLRTMLMGHSKLFAPPELFLLPFDSMDEWDHYLNTRHWEHFKDGLIETLMKLANLDVNEAKSLIAKWIQEKKSIVSVYNYIIELLGDKILVDKTPPYSEKREFLEQALKKNSNAHFIYLYRHPLSVMGSLVKNRFHKLLGVDGDAWKFAADAWENANNNIINFISQCDKSLVSFIRYEDLVNNPKEVMFKLCRELEIEFEDSLLTPYIGDRMLCGVHNKSLSIGDPNFLNHNTIEKNLADSWKHNLSRKDYITPLGISIMEYLDYSFDNLKNDNEGVRWGYVVSPCQRRILEMNSSLGYYYIQTVDIEIDDFKLEVYQDRFNLICNNNDVINNVFLKIGDSWYQKCQDYKETLIQYNDFSICENANDKIRTVIEDCCRSINPLLGNNIALIINRLQDNKYSFVLIIHAIISDRITTIHIWNAILNNVFLNKNSYFNYVSKINKYISTNNFLQHKEKWMKEIENFDYGIKISKGKGLFKDLVYKDFIINKSDIDVSNCSNFFYLIAVNLYFACGKKWNLNNPIIYHRLHRRNLSLIGEYNEVLGRFVGDIPISINVEDEMVFQNFEYKVKTLFPISMAYELLEMKDEVPESPYNICLNFQPNINPSIINWNAYEKYNEDEELKYDLLFIVREHSEYFEVILKYSKEQFLEEEMLDLLNQLKNRLEK